jgi:hypothetical protein
MDHIDSTGERVDVGTGEIHAGRAPAGVIAPKLFFIQNWAGLERFVTDLMHDTERNTPGYQWCRKWFKHPEAITIFYALYRSYLARTDPEAVNALKAKGENPEAALNSWLIHELGPQMSYLLSDYGPFSDCTNTRHSYKGTEKSPDTDWKPYWALERIGTEA